MTITATLVYQAPNRLCWRVVATAGSAEAVVISGADLVTAGAAYGGVINNIVNVKTRGYGKLAAGGTITQAIARALLLSDDAASVVGTDHNPPTASLRIEQRSGTGTIVGDADVDGGDSQSPELNIAATAAGAASAMVWLEVPGAIGA